MTAPSSDVAFTPAVKQVQAERGSRAAYARLEARGGFRTDVTAELVAFLQSVDTAYLATASAAGQPYAQHRGGPPGFIRPLDARTLGWADFRGNRQFVSTGNLSENPRAFLFLMDYAARRRMKVWGRAQVVRDDAALLARLAPAGYYGVVEQAIVFDVAAWDVNCPQHIPMKLGARESLAALEALERRVAELEGENARLRRRLVSGGPGLVG